MPWNSVRGRKSFHLNTPRKVRVVHQPFFSSLMNGRLKPTACWLDSSLTWKSLGLSTLVVNGPESLHWLGIFLLFSTLYQIHSLVMSGLGLIPCQDFFVFWKGWWQGFGVGDEGAWVLRVLICSGGSSGLGVSRCSWRNAAACRASGSLSSSARSAASSSGVGRF